MNGSQKLACAASIALLSFSTSAFGELLLHYNFDEAASGTTAAIDTGTVPAANGTFGGSSTRTNITPGGLPMGAMDTNGGGTTSYLAAGDVDKMDGLSRITVSAWINLQAAPGQYDRIVSDHDTLNQGWEFFLENPSSGTRSAANFRLSITVNNTAGPLSLNLSADNQWLFVAATYDGTQTSNNLKYYTGGLSTSVALSAGASLNAGAAKINATDFRIGSTARTASDRTPDAYIDDVRVYNELLGTAQLESIRATSVPEPASFGLAAIAVAGLLGRRRR